MKKSVTFVKALSFAIALGFAPSLLNAQAQNTNKAATLKNLPEVKFNSTLGTFSASFDQVGIESSDLVANLSQWLGGSSNDTFVVVKTWRDDLGFNNTMYQHLYKGVKVQDDLVIVHEKDGKVVYVNGEFVNNLNVEINNGLSKQEVISAIASEAKVKAENINLSPIENVIAKVNTKDGLKVYNATYVSASTMVAPIISKKYAIENTSKKVVNAISLIHNVDTPSLSTTYYKGNQNITVDSYNGSFRLKDNARKIWTLDGTNLGNGGLGVDNSGYVVPVVNNQIAAVEYTNATANYTGANTKAPVEVHWAIATANDFYKNKFNRNSFDGMGTAVANYYNVDFSIFNQPGQANPTPVGYGANATALTLTTSNGGQVHAMAYGNGNLPSTPGAFNPFASIDVGGHEYSHLIVGNNGSGGLNYSGESGALNESFADILGTSIEFYGDASRANWTIGEGLLNFQPGYLRSMSSPKLGPAALQGQQPDTYGGQYWANPANLNDGDHGGVHTNSGVGNKWFYLLSVGGSGTNDSGRAYNVTGITIDKASNIAYRTLTGGYLTPNSTYADAYNASKQATIALYGTASNELQQVENAWCAVGVGSCANLLAVTESTKSTESDIKIYPNPITNGQFTIESNLKGNAVYEIYDLSGRIIKQADKLEKGSNKISISGAEAGVYIVKVNAEGKTISKKIINK